MLRFSTHTRKLNFNLAELIYEYNIIITKFSQIAESTVGYLGLSSVRYCLALIVGLPQVSN